ncbi:hypothetical protein [Kushneria phosphatilytica]|uniref:Uncharacterized protein n=1 Tax=Kushneria phosphatilytica TaxID=657387 RepID=A0A1S1NW06_9GAMM|nr:hypothetical protein [Kushneria phosphatilytica]OHV12141.1 hypothetical protein BH688_05670 [Kushneria phosphatilytica]QEL11334.1 hypothetical protein FY550_09410 [Kushneria phosphatilytica]
MPGDISVLKTEEDLVRATKPAYQYRDVVLVDGRLFEVNVVRLTEAGQTPRATMEVLKDD